MSIIGNEAWEGHSGLEVETWIKDNIRELQSSLGGKFGYAEYRDSYLYFYEYEGAQEPLLAVSLSGELYSINLNCNLPQVFYVLGDELTTPMTIEPTTVHTSIGSSDTEPFPESYVYTVAVNSGNGYVPCVPETIIPEGGSSTFDIRDFLTVGNNYVRITVTGQLSGQTRTSVYTAVLTSLWLSVNHSWQVVWHEGESYLLNNIRFAGNVEKTLHVSVNGVHCPTVDYSAGQNYNSTSTTYTIPAAFFPASEGNGVYEVEIWLTSQNVSTNHIKYNILCAATGDDTPMVNINAIAAKAVNYTTQRIFSYSVYKCDEVAFDLTAVLGGISYPINVDNAEGLVDGSIYSFSYNIEVDTGTNNEQLGTLDITATAFFESTEGDSTTVSTVFDNTYSYLATPGALFYMNAANRTNNDSDREKIINEMGASSDGNFLASYDGVWSKMAWSTDGWYRDTDNNPALTVPAGSSLSLPDFSPFSYLSYNQYSGGMTFELMFRCDYPADYDTPVITMCDSNNPPRGLRIYPNKIVLLGGGAITEINQFVNINENTPTHIAITFVKNYEGVTGRNLASIYVNGISNVNFAFESSDFGGSSLKIGQDDTDVYIYRMRVYGVALDSQSVFNNYLNCAIEDAVSRRQRYEKNQIYDGNDISYELVKSIGLNTMVVTMPSNSNDIPSFTNNATYNGCSLLFEYADDSNKNVLISDVKLRGQGTTSMGYFRWNLRADTNNDNDHVTTWEYGDGTSGPDGKTGRMINDDSYIEVDRITAKKNYASSMQGHKMGMTGLYNDLFKQQGFGSHIPDDDLQVAVYQFPFVGFRKYVNPDRYEFIGIYTAGPDKGSKVTFGYTSDYPNLLSLEGPDHDPRGTVFMHPWIGITYSNEKLNFDGEAGWECSFTNKKTDEAVMAQFESEWRPAYESVYNNSPYIASVDEVIAAVNDVSIQDIEGVLDPANASTIAAAKMPNGLAISSIEFYSTPLNKETGKDAYDRYYYGKDGQGNYVFRSMESANDPLIIHNLLDDLADYLDEYCVDPSEPTTAEIIAMRAARFKDIASNYWDMDQTLYHYCFCEMFAVSDNFAKNSYPFKFRAFSDVLPEGANINQKRWGWRQDDMDTVFMTDNNGNNTKSYYVEPGDIVNSTQVFQGYNSALWTLIHDNFFNEIQDRMSKMCDAAATLAGEYGVTGASLNATLLNLVSYYCWEHSAKYFSELLYEGDRRWSYIEPWLEDAAAEYNQVKPLTQALGDQYQGERLWVERRAAYIMSKYSIGPFTIKGQGCGDIEFTPGEYPFTFNLTPAIELYPTVVVGDSGVRRGERTSAGTTSQVSIQAPSGSTIHHIKGGDLMEDIGDLHTLQLSARGGGVITFLVSGSRLLRLKVGDATDTVLFNAEVFGVTSESIREIDAQNVTTISGSVSLVNCPRLTTVLFAGSSASGLRLPEGAKITELSFPDNSEDIYMPSLLYLDNAHLTLPSLDGVKYVYIENCGQLNPVTILKDIVNTTGNVLSHVTALWEETMQGDLTIFNTLASLTYLAGYVEYNGEGNYNPQGGGATPHIEGSVDTSSDTVTMAEIPSELTYSLDEAYGEGLRRIWISNFSNRLPIIYNPEQIWPTGFPSDGRIWAYATVDSDGNYNITGDINSVSAIEIDGTAVTKQNSQYLTAGDHLIKFTMSNTTTLGQIFRGMRIYTKVVIPDTYTTLGTLCFYDVGTSSKPCKIVMDKNKITSIGGSGASIVWHSYVNFGAIEFPNLTTLNASAFSDYYGAGSFLTSVKNLGSITSIPNGCFQGCIPKDKTYRIPSTVTSIGNTAFYNNVQGVLIYCYATVPPTFGSNVFQIAPAAIYVPAESVEDYKAASGWSAYASKIQAIPTE